jgi:hypothetical protein
LGEFIHATTAVVLLCFICRRHTYSDQLRRTLKGIQTTASRILLSQSQDYRRLHLTECTSVALRKVSYTVHRRYTELLHPEASEGMSGMLSREECLPDVSGKAKS